jgi:hypothetical protein
VLIALIFLPKLRLRLFPRMVAYICICDFIGSVASSFGYPRNDSLLCPVQAFFLACFYKGLRTHQNLENCFTKYTRMKGSWLWTTMLSHQLYSVIMFGKYGLREDYMHYICWSLSIMTTLTPLTFSDFGRDDDSGEAHSWCFLSIGK